MGWLWSTETSQKSQTTSRNQSTPDSSISQSPPEKQQREHVERELRASLFEDEIAENLNFSHISNKGPVLPSSRSLGTHESISEHLLPATMSCRDAFDSAFYCTSLGGAFNHLYRYGTARSCSEHWNKFWFCMRTRTYSDETKEKYIKDYYRNVEKVKYGKRGTSSEDVWKSRDCLVEKGTAFRADKEWNRTDEEWRNAVLKMRKKIIETAESSCG